MSPFQKLVEEIRTFSPYAADLLMNDEFRDKVGLRERGEVTTLFTWGGTPQGSDYWHRIEEMVYDLRDSGGKNECVF